MGKSNIKITVGVVTYNNINEIEGLMDSIEKCDAFDLMQVYVLDNASSDNTVNNIRKKYLWCRVTENQRNLGFGGGHNKIIQTITSKYHIIANPDIRIQKDTITKCIDYMEKNPDVVVLSPNVLNLNGTQQFLPKKNPKLKYVVGGFFDDYIPLCKKLRREYTLENEDIKEPIDVEFCTGCFMVTRTKALKEVGGFDEIYFLYFEDADLTRKLRKIGRAIYHPNICVIHGWKRENRKCSKNFFIAIQSMFRYMWKWRNEIEES